MNTRVFKIIVSVTVYTLVLGTAACGKDKSHHEPDGGGGVDFGIGDLAASEPANSDLFDSLTDGGRPRDGAEAQDGDTPPNVPPMYCLGIDDVTSVGLTGRGFLVTTEAQLAALMTCTVINDYHACVAAGIITQSWPNQRYVTASEE